MKKKKICPICGVRLQKGEAGFTFPRLPAWEKYGKFSGNVHRSCLLKHPEAADIRRELLRAYLNYSPHPAMVQDRGILIQNHEKDGCIVVYDFEDFAIFPIHYDLINEVRNMPVRWMVMLDASGFLRLETDDHLGLRLHRPISGETVTLQTLSLGRLKKLLADCGERLSLNDEEFAVYPDQHPKEAAIPLEAESGYK